MSGLPLLEGVLKYAGEKNISFCMPGHKGGRGFLETPEGEKLVSSFLKCDVTEVEGVDNLHKAEGIIKESLKLLSDYYGSKKSYMLINGSTCGNLIMIFSAFNEGDKIIVERNCHKSVMNGIILRKLKPVYIKNKMNHKYNAPLSVDEEHLLDIIENNKDAKGIILTYPSYYGVCLNLKKIIDKAHENKMLVLADAAHGAHFGVNNKLPESPVKLGADMVVMSAHKTLPSLTQTSFLHIGNNVDEERVNFYAGVFQSTSPSYLFMCSMDYARYYLEKYGEEEYEKLIYLTEKYREQVNTISQIHVLGAEEAQTEECREVYAVDPTRFVINAKIGISGYKILSYLRSCGIQAEMADANNVVLIFSPFNHEYEFEKLYYALRNCPFEDMKEEQPRPIISHIPEAVMMPFEAVQSEKELLTLKEAEGRICAENIVPYPPGVPLVTMGEIIDNETVNVIRYYLKNNAEVLGLNNGRISCIAGRK